MGFNAGMRALFGMATLALALVLAGCIQVDAESDFSSDGSARHAITMSIDRSAADQEMLGSAIDFNEVERDALAAGLEVERIDTDEHVGVRIALETDDNETPGEALNRLFAAIDDGSDTVEAFSGSFQQAGDDTFEFELTLDANELFGNGEQEIEDEYDVEFGIDMLRQIIEMSYTVNMPGELTDHNGTELSETEVRWELPFEGDKTFIASSKGGGGLPLAWILGIGGGFMALALVAVGGTVLLRGRAQSTEQEVSGRRGRGSGKRRRR